MSRNDAPTVLPAAPSQETGLARFDPQSLVQQAIEKGADVEVLERLLALAKDVRAENARDLWNKAMAEFQRTCPPIRKTSSAQVQTRTGQNYTYSYASLDEIMETIRPVMGPLGLSVAWRGRFEGKVVVQNCRVSHSAGHFEESGEMPIPIDEGGMGASAAQRIGIATTYAKRYALLSIIGMAPEDDVDGAELKPKAVAQPQRKSTQQNAAQKPAAAPRNGCPPSSPWSGDLSDIVHVADDGPEHWILKAEQDTLRFVTDQVDIKDRAAEAMSNAKQVRIEWKLTKAGSAYVETLVTLQDA